MNTLLGKLAYGLAFCAVLPAVLVWWALRTAVLVPLPVPQAPLVGAACTGGGLLLMAWGMGSLWFQGGTSLLSVGVSLLTGSASGLWLVSPVLTLAWLALVYGFENADLRQRFPHRPVGKSLVSLPPATATPAPVAQQLRVAAVVFGPWLLLYETVIFLGPSRSPVSTFLGFEQS